jgi:NAD-dependent aldehyde dehydrogenases
LRLAELIKQAGLPDGWVQVAMTSRENSENWLLIHVWPFSVLFGSAKVGWYLKSKLAPGTRCALEHGGVAPLIFDEYADEEGFLMV